MMKKTTISVSAIVITSMMALVACEEKNVVPELRIANAAEVFSANGDLKKNALIRAGLYEDLKNISSVTLFLPSEDAFRRAGYFSVESVTEGEVAPLRDIILYHAIEGASFSASLASGLKATLSAARNVTISTGSLDVSPVTGVAISGIGNVNGAASVEQVDVDIANGVVHSLNSVLLPVPRNLDDILLQNGEFELLKAAIIQANLLTTLGATGAFTLFAPTDAAFIAHLDIATKNADKSDRTKAAIMADALAAINALPVSDLADMLTYHVAGNRLTLEQLLALTSITTLNGDALVISKSENKDGSFSLKGFKGISNDSDAKTIQGDVLASNGILHAVDKVLKP